MATSESTPTLRFTDKVVVVTGGCGGIGKSCVDVFLENGANVVIFDINEEIGTRLATESPGRVMFVKCDVSKEDEVKRSVDSLIGRHGQLDCLINNAGVVPTDGAIDGITLERFQNTINVNLFGYFLMCKYALPHLRKTKGTIVNVASIVGHIGCETLLPYTVTKGAILAMTKTLAIDEAKNGVRINSVSPGQIYTPMTRLRSGGDEDRMIKLAERNLLGRFGDTLEVGRVCFFLACDATYCTGTDILVTAGLEVGLGIKTIHVQD